ncbi:hypothetical protein [Sinorhizobium meliloti]|uniref:hypothetical protein n=1 Tax=Rhizobium meliloti TaxID=382 RepID=UPI001860F88C|nr:hypothetical protein [Sinorhizobium meliloti]QND24987.1 hypothetical protein HB773_13395 [Sinorhizobium meliloti]QND30851.1 hypothetical protein HB772_15240 [Sinorhizobium meliloti]QPI27370.1 hypothetical protein I0J99_11785 [Sinorhizobium meliloti]WQP02607.1 hypothetical protein U8C41_26760 [Sinorhizobium meliloti]WQP22555.1 hypothetical protein U8C33_28780 [Sinorhizobium meliloti]
MIENPLILFCMRGWNVIVAFSGPAGYKAKPQQSFSFKSSLLARNARVFNRFNAKARGHAGRAP